MVERVWLKHYPHGVPAEIDPDSYRSLAHLLEDVMVRHAEQAATVCLGRTLTYGDLDRLSTRFAAWLGSLGLPKGSRVALMMPNCHAYVVSLLGTLRAGMTALL